MKRIVAFLMLAACEASVPRGAPAEVPSDVPRHAAELETDAGISDRGFEDTGDDAGHEADLGSAAADAGAASADAAARDAVARDALAPDVVVPDAGQVAIEDGTWARPFSVRSFPCTFRGDTRTEGAPVADSYSPCAPSISEAGPEIVFAIEIGADGTLVASVDDVPGDDVDIDLQLLERPDRAACVARTNVSLRRAVRSGDVLWLSADTWHDGRDAKAGPFTLTVDLLPPATGSCPADMVAIEGSCMDTYEAPNRAGALPLVMYSFNEADAWCRARNKRLCFDDEWTLACATASGTRYPYGDTHRPGVCNDEETWRRYDQLLLNGWPAQAAGADVIDVMDLFARASAISATARQAADHVRALYQAEPAGQNAGCTNALGVFDLTGNVEEWTRRRDGGNGPGFSGNLKGRYWAESRTCQSGVLTHGNGFHFYEIGFRCCSDRPGP